MAKLRDGVPIPEPGAAPGLDEGVDTFNDLLDIVSRCLPNGPDPFTQSAYIWAGLHGYVALQQVIPAFPWPAAGDYLQRMIGAARGRPRGLNRFVAILIVGALAGARAALSLQRWRTIWARAAA